MIERRLADVAPGEIVEFVGFDATLDPSVRDRLLAYGVALARRLEVTQQRPLTIVVCDHAELALEAAVARSMRVRGVRHSERACHSERSEESAVKHEKANRSLHSG
jgi:hypothetical protein